ncbi:hypothetical protein M0802_016498 [Mischocyttarus mexicanus]|nr:hypothetical protein M0802_016498 [Mischocyttarus mexicanus]
MATVTRSQIRLTPEEPDRLVGELIKKEKQRDEEKQILEQIPRFDGYNIFVHSFTGHCRIASSKLSKYLVQDLIECFKQRLTGSAYRLFIEVKFQSVEEFLCSVKRTFAAKKTLVHYFGDLNQLRQKPNESIVRYACRTRELETALIDSIKTEFPENSAQIINKVETDLLKGFTDGITTSIRTELRLNGNKTLTDAIADAIALENKTTLNPPNPSYNRNNNNRNSNGRYEERYTNTENRTYRFNYNQDRRYPDQPPRYTDRNNDNYNQHRSIMYNDQKYPNANNRNLNRDYNRDIRHFNCYQNLQPRFFPEKRRNYRQHNYRNQRSENYENNKTYNTYENSKLKNVGNAFSPLAYYETYRFDTRTDTHPTGSRTAQTTRPEAGTELTYAIQQETPLCNLSNTTNSKIFSYNVLPFEPVKFVSGGFLTDPKPRISSYVRVLNPEIPKILLKEQELTPKAYSNDAKNAVTMTSSAFSLQQVKNVEDIIDVEEINDRRININKEVNIEEIDSKEINKGVKLRKEKLNGKEINHNNFERKVGELGDGQATSDVDSHTRRPALEGKILEIIKCKEFMAAKPNEATSDVDKSEKIGEKSFNEERNETNQVLKNACETVEETEVEVGEIDDETTYSDFYKLLLEIKIDKEFDIQHNPQELDNLFHENNSEAGVKTHNQKFYSEEALKSLIISKDRLIEYNSGIKYKFGKATVNADTGFDNSIALFKPMALWNTLKKIFKNTRKRQRCYFPSRRTAKKNRIFRINIQTPKVLKSFNHLHRLQYRPRYLYPPPRIPLVHTNLTLAQY